MSSLLYYSISSNLTQNEIIEVDRRVAKDREAVYLFFRELPSNPKRKAKRLGLYIVILFIISQPLVPDVDAVMMPLPPSIHRSSPMEQGRILSNKTYYPKIAHILEEKVDKIRLTNEQIKQFNNLALQLDSGSITMEEAVLELRGGSGLTDVAAILAFVIFANWYDSLFGTEAFQAIPLPHMDPMGWSSGKYNSKNAGNGQCLSHPPSRFERETLYRMRQICAASADENGFVMGRDEALKLVSDTYGGSTQITEDCKVTNWQIAKKAYHFHKGFNMDLDSYDNFDKQDLVNLQNTNGGLITYVQKGSRLPPIQFINDAKKQLTDFCLLEKTEVITDAQHYGQHSGVTPAIMFHNNETGRIAIFNKTSGDLITTETYKPKPFNKFVEGCYLGNRPKT